MLTKPVKVRYQIKGVRWNKQVNKWQAYITVLNKEKSLGRFDHGIDAECARLAGELKYWGEIKSTTMTAEAKEFRDKLIAADNPQWLMEVAIRSPHEGTEGVRWNGRDCLWVAYTNYDNELRLLGKYIKFEDAADRVRLENIKC